MPDLFRWFALRPKTTAWLVAIVLITVVIVLNTYWYINKVADERDKHKEEHDQLLRVARNVLKDQSQKRKQAEEALDDIFSLTSEDGVLTGEAMPAYRRD